MIVQAFLYLLILILAFYWLTCIVQFLGIPIYGKDALIMEKAFIPFYYWTHKTESEKAKLAELEKARKAVDEAFEEDENWEDDDWDLTNENLPSDTK